MFDRADGKYYPPEEDMPYLMEKDLIYCLESLRKEWKTATSERRFEIVKRGKEIKKILQNTYGK